MPCNECHCVEDITLVSDFGFSFAVAYTEIVFCNGSIVNPITITITNANIAVTSFLYTIMHAVACKLFENFGTSVKQLLHLLQNY